MHKTKCFADLIRLGASRKRTPTLDSFLDFLHSQCVLDIKKMRVSPFGYQTPCQVKGSLVSWR